MSSIIITTLSIVCLAVIIASGIKVVKQQTIAIVESFGKYKRSLKPGLNWIVPGVEQIVYSVDLRVSSLPAVVEVKTKDNAFVKLPVALMVQVVEDHAKDAYYQLQNPGEQVTIWALNTMRSTSASMTLAELYEDREKLAESVQEALAAQLSGYGYKIVSVLVDQPTISPELQQSFDRVLASERDKEAALRDAEAKRTRIVGEAQADAEAQQLRATGLAEARRILAMSFSEAVESAKCHGLKQNEVMDFLLETNRLDTLRHASEYGRLVVMDVRGKNDPGIPFTIPIN